LSLFLPPLPLSMASSRRTRPLPPSPSAGGINSFPPSFPVTSRLGSFWSIPFPWLISRRPIRGARLRPFPRSTHTLRLVPFFSFCRRMSPPHPVPFDGVFVRFIFPPHFSPVTGFRWSQLSFGLGIVLLRESFTSLSTRGFHFSPPRFKCRSMVPLSSWSQDGPAVARRVFLSAPCTTVDRAGLDGRPRSAPHKPLRFPLKEGHFHFQKGGKAPLFPGTAHPFAPSFLSARWALSKDCQAWPRHERKALPAPFPPLSPARHGRDLGLLPFFPPVRSGLHR